ncbi:phenoloxidase-activating factor 2-like [Thrips palmi]|uniref:Phenoloxidase-activating factor 2 n=1 Tax=Thrips palmi TaxID=161013 RepID=A0A6P8ZJB5_THRPL|nr:phenoloxidase-activating factor 2-like [Thrips palmi]XP_034235064.1 phenoloxidase-activating factor 2-like [Thrips palmi]XP_034235065.1 phenoloxidase-activating factor 2-like [Thrips palmi]
MVARLLAVTAMVAVAAVAMVAALPPAKTPSRAPASPAAPAADGLPSDILCGVYGGSYCGGASASKTPAVKPKPSPARPAPTRRSRRQAQGAADPAAVDPSQICSIFGGPSCPTDENKVYEPCSCPNGGGSGCECVPYYQCDGKSGEYNKDGVGLIDIRQKPQQTNSSCAHYLQQCCRIREGSGPSPGDNPSGPYPGDNPPYPGDNPGDNNPGGNPGDNPGGNYPGDNPGPGPGPQDPAPPVYNPSQACGIRYRNGVGSRISGAMHDETNFGEIPWMVAIFKKRQADVEYLCGGGLIAPNVVLTAAHCINEKAPSSLTVRAGEWDSRTEEEAFKHQDRDVDYVITHPDYKPLSLHNDVGLLVLREPVKVGYHIGTICMPEQDQSFDYKNCLVSGWGKDVFGKDGVYQNILRRIDDLPVVPHSQCQDKLRRTRLGPYFRLNGSFMCAGGVRGKDACTGDGGSPLVCPINDNDDDSRYVYAGIVSWGVGCGEEDVPGVYVNVALFRSWIEESLSTHNVQVCSP